MPRRSAPAEAQGLDGAHVAGVGQRHDVARVDQRPHHQLERLLGAVGDDDVVGVGAVALRSATHARSGAKPAVAAYWRAPAASSASTSAVAAAIVSTGKRVGRGQAAGEGQHVGLLGHGEQVADGRRADALRRRRAGAAG